MTETISQVYFDSVLIEFGEGGDRTPHQLTMLFQLFEKRAGLSATCLLTLGEVLGREGPYMQWQDQKSFYRGLLSQGNIVNVIPVDEPILLKAADFRRQARLDSRSLRLADAIHAASAAAAFCETFLTADIRLAQNMPPPLRPVIASPEGLSRFLQTLDA